MPLKINTDSAITLTPESDGVCRWSGIQGDNVVEGLYRGWFSPRRFHQLAEHDGNLFVIGGRAREHKRLSNERTVGLTSPKQMQLKGRRGSSTWREPAVLKNDVWLSGDGGANWRLVFPGCHVNEEEPGLMLKVTEDGNQYVGDKSNKCETDLDCYSTDEECSVNSKICVCKIWSPREQHRVAVHNGFMFLIGGFASTHRSYCKGDACGDTDAGGYRQYLSDVWYWDLNQWAVDGKASWETQSVGAEFADRGGHSLSVMEMLPRDGNGVQSRGVFALWVIGGKTGSVDDKSKDAVLNDAWYTILEEDLKPEADWTWHNACPGGCGWPGRYGHATVVDKPSESNLFTQRVYVIGGEAQDGSLLNDVWSWGWECMHDERVPTAAATDTINEASRGVWRGFCTSKKCVEGTCQPNDPNNDVNLVPTELQNGVNDAIKYCMSRVCDVAGVLSEVACRTDDDCESDGDLCVDSGFMVDQGAYRPCTSADDCPVMSVCAPTPSWRQDYQPDALFRAKVPGGANMPESTFSLDPDFGHYVSDCKADAIGPWFYDQGAPQQHYVDGDSEVSKLVKIYLPLDKDAPSHAASQGFPKVFAECPGHYGIVPRRKQLITDGTDGTQDRLGMLHTMGIFTIRDLAEASKEQIVELRGYRNPGAAPLVNDIYEDVCDHKAFAEAVLDKCRVQDDNHPLTHYDMENMQPWNVQVKFGPGSPPLETWQETNDDDPRAYGTGRTLDGQASGSLKTKVKLKTHATGSPFKARWHCGRDQYPCQNPRADVADEILIEQWDGCRSILGGGEVDVPGIGGVPPPDKVKDPSSQVRELVCKQNPGPRAYHTGAFFDGKVYVMGGLENKTTLKAAQDMWYRDDNLPRAELGDRVPAKALFDSVTTMFDIPEYQFYARAADEAVLFEYLVYDADENQVVRTWDRSLGKAQVNWLDKYYENGPGSGFYIFYVRAVDAAGNVDVVFDGLNFRNMYKWKYNTRLPWDYIGYSVLSFLTCVLVAYKEYQRRKRKAAMERYAIKRMRRKFKGAQKEMNKGGVDWRKMMDDDKKKRAAAASLPFSKREMAWKRTSVTTPPATFAQEKRKQRNPPRRRRPKIRRSWRRRTNFYPNARVARGRARVPTTHIERSTTQAKGQEAEAKGKREAKKKARVILELFTPLPRVGRVEHVDVVAVAVHAVDGDARRELDLPNISGTNGHLVRVAGEGVLVQAAVRPHRPPVDPLAPPEPVDVHPLRRPVEEGDVRRGGVVPVHEAVGPGARSQGPVVGAERLDARPRQRRVAVVLGVRAQLHHLRPEAPEAPPSSPALAPGPRLRDADLVLQPPREGRGVRRLVAGQPRPDADARVGRRLRGEVHTGLAFRCGRPLAGAQARGQVGFGFVGRRVLAQRASSALPADGVREGGEEHAPKHGAVLSCACCACAVVLPSAFRQRSAARQDGLAPLSMCRHRARRTPHVYARVARTRVPARKTRGVGLVKRTLVLPYGNLRSTPKPSHPPAAGFSQRSAASPARQSARGSRVVSRTTQEG